MTKRAELTWLAAILAAAAAVRAAYVAAMGLPVFDPWRHLALLENLREGRGFTLFEGQPYVWYDPLWYRLCALLPRAVGMDVAAAFFSWASAAAVYGWLRRRTRDEGGETALAGAALVALFGPFV